MNVGAFLGFIGIAFLIFLVATLAKTTKEATKRTNISRQLGLSNAQAEAMVKYENVVVAELGRPLLDSELLTMALIAQVTDDETAKGVASGHLSPMQTMNDALERAKLMDEHLQKYRDAHPAEATD